MSAKGADSWSLEVVRGKDLGKRFALTAPSLVLGNAPGRDRRSTWPIRKATHPGEWPRSRPRSTDPGPP